MTSVLVKTIVGVVGLSFVLALPAEAAKKRKHRQQVGNATVASPNGVRYRDQNLFMRGPISFGGKYLGDDPDPFIRSQIYRDPGAVFGGDGG